MDMVTRKKFLLRKYNSSSFSAQQLGFFGRLNASEIIILLKQNPNLRSCPVFFQHTPVKQIEKVIASIFEPEQNFLKTQIFNILLNILKQSTLLLDVCFNNEDFNYMSIFGFLQEQNIQYPILILMEDVLLPYIRKTPYKIMQIISNDSHVEGILLNRMYDKPVFKIMYTVIFCLSKRHSQIYKNDIKKIVNQIINTPFTYLIHQQNISEQKITVVNKDKSPNKRERIYQKLDSQKQFAPLHIKQVRQRNNNTLSSRSSERSIGREGCSPKKKAGLSKQLGSNKQPLELKQSQAKYKVLSFQSLAQLWKLTCIPFKSDLDLSDLSFNIKHLFSDISFNIKSVYLRNVICLLQNFNQQYINCLFYNCRKFILNQQYQGYCQGVISILEEFGQLYRAVNNHLVNLVEMGVKNGAVVGSENQELARALMGKLQRELRIIVSKIPFLIECILQNNQPSYLCSSGEKLKKVGFVKYKMLQLILALLQLNNSETHPNLQLAINFEQFDLFLVAEKYLTTLKWNNLMHNIIVKIIKIALEKDYMNFKKRYITQIQMPKDGILGKLIQLFRNKKFVFLKNMKFTNYGNLNVIYQIGKLISLEVKKHGDYELLTQRFAPFVTFLNKDLGEYQKNIGGSDFMERDLSERHSHVISSIVPFVDMNGKIVNESLQKVQEILDQIENSKRWTPLLWRNQKKLESLVPVDNFQSQCAKNINKKL